MQQPDDNTRWRDPRLVGKLGYDSKGNFGIVRSPDNGVTWILTDTVYGHVFNDEEIGNIWNNGTSHRVKDMVDSATADIPNALSAAQSAVDYVDSAIAASKVNSANQSAMSEAIAEAKAGADEALKKANSAVENVDSQAASIRSDVASVEGKIDAIKSEGINIAKTASEATITAKNAASQAMVAKASAEGVSIDLLGVKKTAEAAANQASVASDNANKVAQRVTTNEMNISATQKLLQAKADQATVDDTNKTVEKLSGQISVVAGQLEGKTDKTTVDEINKKMAQMSVSVKANTDGLSTKADKTTTDAINKKVDEQTAQQQILAGEIKEKITSAQMTNYVQGQGFATQTYAQNIVDKKADSITETLTELDKKVGTNQADTVKRIQSISKSLDGVQSIVKDNQQHVESRFTQLSNTFQSKVFDSIRKAGEERSKTDAAFADKYKTVEGAQDLNDYTNDGKFHLTGQLTNAPYKEAGDVILVVTQSFTDSKDKSGKAVKVLTGVTQEVFKQNDDSPYKRQATIKDNKATWSGWSVESKGASTTITQAKDDLNLQASDGDLLSQINLQAGRALIQSKKIYLDADTVVMGPKTKAFIPSAAITNLDADKITSGTLNTNNVNLGDGRTRLRADHDFFYIQPTGSASSDTGIRMGYSGLEFLTNVIPNGYSSSVPYYGIGYDGAANGYLRITAFDHINPGGTTANQLWYTAVDAISLTNKEVNIGAGGTMRLQAYEGGVKIRPTLFFDNANSTGTWAGFNRADNSNTVEFNTGDNNGENFHVNSGARFMQYVYINGYAKAQGWLTNSTLSKKTNIAELDTKVALDKIRQDKQYTYEYKRNVERGENDPQASFVIDDVHDVSQYSVPREFIDRSGKYREPNVELAYLVAAFQELDKQVQELKEKNNG